MARSLTRAGLCATAGKFRGDWLLTGDQAIVDDEGYFHFVGRDDDIINSAGYRVGPGEIEDCLASHPAVRLAAAVGKPDPLPFLTTLDRLGLAARDAFAIEDSVPGARAATGAGLFTLAIGAGCTAPAYDFCHHQAENYAGLIHPAPRTAGRTD